MGRNNQASVRGRQHGGLLSMPEMQSGQKPAPLPQGNPTRPSTPLSDGDTVCVACKIPQGVIMDHYEMVDDFESMYGGGSRPIKRSVPTGRRFILAGLGKEIAAMRQGVMPMTPNAGGYAITAGIPREFWEWWSHAYRDQPMLNPERPLVFAEPTLSRALARARELSATESGFEPIDPNDPRKRTGMRAVTSSERPPGANTAPTIV